MAKDVDLFAASMAGVKPLNGRLTKRAVIAGPQAAGPSMPSETSRTATAVTVGARPAPVPQLAPGDGAFDRDIDRSLLRGRLEPEGTLDLHGLTLASAERAVTRFVEQAVSQDCRVVLVVTGKGIRQQDGGRIVEGRIRAEFVGWLNRADNRARVRAVRAAHPRHGGTGAFYLLLRRRSSASKRSLRTTPQR